jgi:hypothetical protein
MNNKNISIIIYIAIGLFLYLIFKTPATYKTFILPTWDKPTAMCKDEYFTWEWHDDICKHHKGVRYIFEY